LTALSQDIDPALKTRLRLARRLAVLAIIVIVGLLVLVQFGPLKQMATGVLASTALIGLVVGFAAQQLIGNLVAGVLIAFGDPFKIGDWVEIDRGSGRIEDIRLTSTHVHTDDERLIVIPNGHLLTNAVLIGEPKTPPGPTAGGPPESGR
jgi:small-conductance mechanosensitive channel